MLPIIFALTNLNILRFFVLIVDPKKDDWMTDTKQLGNSIFYTNFDHYWWSLLMGDLLVFYEICALKPGSKLFSVSLWRLHQITKQLFYAWLCHEDKFDWVQVRNCRLRIKLTNFNQFVVRFFVICSVCTTKYKLETGSINFIYHSLSTICTAIL